VQVPKDIIDRFYTGNRTPDVKFVVNDTVRVTAGEHEGRTGAVVSIVSLKPEITFTIEPGEKPYGEFQVPQSLLERIILVAAPRQTR